MRSLEHTIGPDTLSHGMAWDAPAPRNGALALCSGAIATPQGLQGWRPVANLASWPQEPAWPFPQLFQGKRFYILAYDTAIYRFAFDDIPEDEAEWLLAKCNLRLSTDSVLPFALDPSDVPWKFIDLGEAWMLLRPEVVLCYFPLQHLFGTTDPLGHTEDFVWVCTSPIVNDGCFCNGRVILGGFNKADLFTASPWLDLFNTYYPECRESFNTILGALMDMDENFVYWSSIGAADALWWFFPQLAITGFLNAYHGTNARPEFIDNMRLGQWGQAPMDWNGAVRAVRPFGNQGAFIVYGDGGVTLMEPFVEPVLGFSKRDLLTGIGIHASGPVSGTLAEHTFLANTGDFYRITAEGINRIPTRDMLPRIFYSVAGAGGGGGASTYTANTWSHPLSIPSFNIRMHEYSDWLEFGDAPGCYVGGCNASIPPKATAPEDGPFRHSASYSIGIGYRYASDEEVAPVESYFELATGVYLQVDNAFGQSVTLQCSYRYASTQAGLSDASWNIINVGTYSGNELAGNIDEFFEQGLLLTVVDFSGYWVQFQWSVTCTANGVTDSDSVTSNQIKLEGSLPPKEEDPITEGPNVEPVPDAPVITGSITEANYILMSFDPLHRAYYITWKHPSTDETIAYVLQDGGLSFSDLQENLVTVCRHLGGLVGVYSAYKDVRYTTVLQTAPIDFGTSTYKTLTGIELGLMYMTANGVSTLPSDLRISVTVTAFDSTGISNDVVVDLTTHCNGLVQLRAAGVAFVIKITLYDPTVIEGDYENANLSINRIRLTYQSDDYRFSRGYNPANAGANDR